MIVRGFRDFSIVKLYKGYQRPQLYSGRIHHWRLCPRQSLESRQSWKSDFQVISYDFNLTLRPNASSGQFVEYF